MFVSVSVCRSSTVRSIPSQEGSFGGRPISTTASETNLQGPYTRFTDHRSQDDWGLSSNVDRSIIAAQRRKMEEVEDEIFGL